jgi:hypothetical protein
MVTAPAEVKPFAKKPTAAAAPVSIEPPAENQPAATLAARNVQPRAKEVRAKPTKRVVPVAASNGGRPVATSQKQRVKAPYRVAVIRNRTRAHGLPMVGAQPLRGFNAAMDATRYRVGRALSCIVRFTCTSRQVAGAAVGAAAGGAAGGGGGAVAGGLAGAVIASRGR